VSIAGTAARCVCFAAGLIFGCAEGFRDGLPGRSRPRRLRPCRHQRSRDVADQSGVRAGSSKGKADAGRHLDNPRAELQKPQANGVELGRGERVCLGDCITQGVIRHIAAALMPTGP
jgi:hypothetical protein